jgi:hypothetical protein
MLRQISATAEMERVTYGKTNIVKNIKSPKNLKYKTNQFFLT